MSSKKTSKFGRVGVIFAVFLLLMSMVSNVTSTLLGSTNVYAVPTESEQSIEEDDSRREEALNSIDNMESQVLDNDDDSSRENTQNSTDNTDNTENQTSENRNENENNEKDGDKKSKNVDGCKSSLGALGWLVCPTTGKIAEAVDWLYEKIEDILVIRPISTDDGTPIYEIWKHFLGFSNIVFIIFLLIVIYSQITGLGISNYGVKKTLPKLIVMALLVNLSFLICLFAIDISNILGNSVRGLFVAVEESAAQTTTMEGGAVSYASLYSSLAGGSALAIGGAVIAFDFGAIWMLIPTVLGAIVAVVTGLITIALRQAVVVLLVMVSPLAIVSSILPNTEMWFRKWKDLLMKMLVFYPMFSLLFGASSLAGFAIIMSARDGFGLMLGMAVQIFPLFFSWKLMQMSGTFLNGINMRLRGLAARPLMANRAWAASHMMNTRMKRLAMERPTTPSLRLMQFMTNRQIERDADIRENMELVKNRGMAYRARRNYSKDGMMPSNRGEQTYEKQARNLEYQQMIMRDANTMNKGLSYMAVEGTSAAARLGRLDNRMINAAVALKTEQARGEKIEYDNAKGLHMRMDAAINAHMDEVNGFEMKDGKKTRRKNYQFHLDPNSSEHNAALAQYNTMRQIMEGSVEDVQFATATTAYGFDTQRKIVGAKMQKYFDMTVPTQDVMNRLNELTTKNNAGNNIDMILSGMRVLNNRGDTDLSRKQLENLFSNRNNGIELGSYAMQAIASYCMFDVKGNDPTLRRFGKYINMQTAKMFNEDDPSERRTRKDISFYEYVNGEYIDRDEKGNVIYKEDGTVVKRKTRDKAAPTLLKGTSFKDIERTAIKSMDEMIRNNSVDISLDEDGNEVKTFNYEKFKENEKKIWDAIMPNVIGDHFSFLSGSEQINAVGKGITGVDAGKHRFDWKGIFGKEVAKQLTPEQKKDYIEFLNKRTKAFLSGQVPSQIARTKSDMLSSIRNQYALREALINNPELFKEVDEADHDMTDEEYERFEEKYLDGVKKEFVGSFKEDALKGFVKMHHKGYQGEAKDGLIMLLDPDTLYNQYFPNGERNSKKRDHRDYDDEDDDGAPVNFSGGASGGTEGAIYNDARRTIDSVFSSYRGSRRLDVNGFWNEIKDIINSSREIQSKGMIIDEIENNLSQYSDTSELYRNVIELIFGGFSD